MTVCYECGREIKGQAKFTKPRFLYAYLYGIDFPKAFHPKCYQKAEYQAEKELKRL